MDDQQRAELLGRMALAGVSAGVATASPAAGIVAGVMVPLVELLHARWLDGQAQRAAGVLSQAIEIAEVEPEEFVERVASEPERLLLAGEAVNAATRATMEAKRDALARTLAVAATAPDVVALDAELMWLRLLAPLEAVHLRALDALDVARPAGASMFDWIVLRKQLLTEALDPMEPVLRTHVLGTVVSSGLARQRYGDDYPASYGLSTGGWAGDRFWEVTSVGREVVSRVYVRSIELGETAP